MRGAPGFPAGWEDIEARPEAPRSDQLATRAGPVRIVHTTNELRAILYEEVRNTVGVVDKVAYNTHAAAIAVGFSPFSIQSTASRTS